MENEEKNVNTRPSRRSKSDVDMTQGSIFRLLLAFALPLLIGNLFQQLYNTVDTWVLGNYATKEAFAAIGCITPIFNLVVNTFVGLSNGAGVVISNYYGAGKMDQVKRTVHTSMVMAVMCSAFFTAFGLIFKNVLIGWLHPSAEMLPHAQVYLGIIFQFLTFQVFYNMASSILRAVGDSRRPFYFLVIACVINIILDLVFVIRFDMGAAGVAYATVIAQCVSAVLSMITLFKTDSCVKVSLKDLCFDLGIFKHILQIGIPGAIQMALISFSNIFVVSYINYFGTDFSSGYTAYFKSELILFLPLSSMGLAVTTFVGQNFGAGKLERAKQGVRTAVRMCLVPVIVLGGLMMIFAPQIIAFFNNDPAVMAYGALFIRVVTPFYLFQCFNQTYTAALRGVRDTFVPMLIMIGCYVGIRQLYLFIMTRYVANVPVVVMACFPVGWTLATILGVIRYHSTDFEARFANLQGK
ncbi:MAG: MATE family efflux transporter [Firmicutes bacterium]|nr:MATE family efflux transporter [Bacillota bacterium]